MRGAQIIGQAVLPGAREGTDGDVGEVVVLWRLAHWDPPVGTKNLRNCSLSPPSGDINTTTLDIHIGQSVYSIRGNNHLQCVMTPMMWQIA